MKITYQKEGIGPKRTLKKLQRFNLALWKILRFIFILFILSFGLFTFVSSKKSPDMALLPDFTQEEKRLHAHNSTAYNLLNDHKAPSISSALVTQFLLHKDRIKQLIYEDMQTSVVLTLIFEDFTREELEEEKQNLLSTGLFISVKKGYTDTSQEIVTVSNPEVFLYSQTVTIN